MVQWSRGPHAVRFEVPSELLASFEGRPLERWLEEWRADDPGAALVDGKWCFTLPYALWEEAGRPPPRGAGAEEIDLFCSRHAAIARLLERASQKLRVESIGHVGAAELSFLVKVDGARVADTAEPTPFVVDGGGRYHALVPCAFVAYQLVCQGNAPSRWTRADQLAFVAELREHLERSREVLAGTTAPFAYELDEHLSELRAQRVSLASLAWRPQKNPAVFDLQVEHVDEEGERRSLDLDRLDAQSPVIELSATEHILLDPEIAEVARVASRQRGKLRKHVERHFANPATLLPEGLALDAIDFSAYSPRVIGFAPIIKVERAFDVQSSGVEWYRSDGDGSVPFLRLLIAQPGGGGVESLTLATPEEAERAADALEQALVQGTAEPIELGGRRVEPSRQLQARIRDDLAAYRVQESARAAATTGAGADGGAGALGAPGAAGVPGAPDDAATLAPAPAAEPEPGRLAATIAEHVEPVRAKLTAPSHPLPWEVLEAQLAPSCRLKEHQRDAVEWLWDHYQRGEAGVLLADDMGLGKTLQLSAFLALLRAAAPRTPRLPSLIVCPVILLDNWQDELRKFFRPAVFASLVVLYGDELRRRKRGSSLELSGLAEADFVLTNYETLQAHQQSLLTLDWNVAILDEAQAIKNPDTYRARAARGLKRVFGVCSTGTPVENRLSDLWSLYDFLRPGDPFTTLQQFQRDYESKSDDRRDGQSSDKNDDTSDDQSARESAGQDTATAGVWRVREALEYPSSRSSLLRRTKAEVLDLPDKLVEIHAVPMTPHQVALEQHLTCSTRESTLKILQGLQKLYQHPQLLLAPEERASQLSVKKLLEESPKLALCLQLLRGVQQAGEKALVFTLWTEMQDMLVEVIKHELGLSRVRVLNGDPAHRQKAKAYIEELSAAPGFGVLVLSPLAAGTGLTITAANHVIHYGRWWNPAKEDQATDRAYRIGQTRPVHVHYPLLHHAGEPERGFDVQLHRLVERKRGLARDFLAPRDEEAVSANELAALARGVARG